jgi:membrane protein YdbS with pleckstrin-like domain
MLALNDNEQIVTVVREHKLYLATRFLPLAAIFGALLLAIALLARYSPNIFSTCPSLFLFPIPIISLAVCLRIFGLIISWMLDATVITDNRILTVKQFSLFHLEVVTLQLERVQDVVVEIQGVLENFFDFGTVTIQTASESAGFTIPHTPHPFVVKEKILALIQEKSSQSYDQPPPISVDI